MDNPVIFMVALSITTMLVSWVAYLVTGIDECRTITGIVILLTIAWLAMSIALIIAS